MMEESKKFRTIDELRDARREFVRVSKAANMHEGIIDMLARLYPDTAHFIYELLQNAEDMNATTVRFLLRPDGLEFAHNGTKRNFTLSDIDAITNIGQSGKKDDRGSIGKFGIGFKAVFSYTQTPEIHSGNYHFRITDYIVPETEGVDRLSTTEHGVAWTKFIFPFDHPRKPSRAAYEETEAGLRGLNENSILFLKHIACIEFSIGDDRQHGLIVRRAAQTGEPEELLTVATRPCGSMFDQETRWLRFVKTVECRDEYDSPKRLTIGVAYRVVGKDAKSGRTSILPVAGKTFIYFPAEKEYSGLRFHVNAPFACNVDRSGIRDSSQNRELVKRVAELVAASLGAIRKAGYLDADFLSVLPNDGDEIPEFYSVIRTAVKDAFRENAYLPRPEGRFASVADALVGRPAFSERLSKDDLEGIWGETRNWLVDFSEKPRAGQFVKDLGVAVFDARAFMRFALEDDEEAAPACDPEAYIAARSDEWLRKFYYLCSVVLRTEEADDRMRYSLYARVLRTKETKEADNRMDAFLERLKKMKFIRSEERRMCMAGEIFLPPQATDRDRLNALRCAGVQFVKNALYASENEADRVTTAVRAFLRGRLGIAEYGERQGILQILERFGRMAGDVDEDYFRDLLVCARYAKKHADPEDKEEYVDFATKRLFLGESETYAALRPAGQLVLGAAYGSDSGETIARVLKDIQCLSSVYQRHYDRKEMDVFLAFVFACGLGSRLHIQEQSANLHPEFASKLVTIGTHITGSGTSRDYCIPDLQRLLVWRNKLINRFIWDTLLSAYNKGLRETPYRKGYMGPEYWKAVFAPNQRHSPRTCESSLVYWLRKFEWVPDKNGTLCTPGHLAVEDIDPEFRYDKQNGILQALNFGSDFAAKTQELKRLEADAAKNGFVMVRQELYKQLMAQAKKASRRAAAHPASSEELLNAQTRHQQGGDGEDDFTSSGAVNNPARFERNIEVTFKDAQRLSLRVRKLYGVVRESSKAEKEQLLHWYGGYCQMCGTRIVDHQGRPCFIGRNVINTRDLPEEIQRTEELAWNSLCLCPNCAARYLVCARDLGDLSRQIRTTEVVEGSDERIFLTIELANRPQTISYVPKHFFALQKVMRLIDQLYGTGLDRAVPVSVS